MQSPVAANAPVRINLLGGFGITVRGDLCTLPTRKVCALLAYLATNLEHRLNKIVLASMLWPTASTKEARHSLNQAVYSLRQAIPDLIIECDRDRIALLASNIVVDYFAFMDAIRRGALLEAEQWFQGQFLEGAHFHMSDDFDEWVENVRGVITHKALTVLEGIEVNAHKQRSVAAIERIASKLLQFQPDDHRALATLKSANAFRGAEDNDRQGAERLPFRGRDAEVRSASGHIASAGSFAQLILVIGVQGVGKTRFAEQLMRIGAIRGMRICFSHSDRAEQCVPFATVQGLLSSLESQERPGQHSNAKDAPLAVGRKAQDYGHADAGYLEKLLKESANSGPLLVVIDDYQWIDRASRTTLLRCVRRLRNYPIAFVVCSRTEGERNRRAIKYLRHAFDRSTSRLIHLRRLADSVVEQLLDECAKGLGIDLSADFKRAVVRTTKGHPLFLSEVVAAIADEAIRELDSADLQRSLVEFLQSRVRNLPRDARHCLRALACIGRRATLSLIASVGEIDFERAQLALRAALKAGLVERAADQWAFAHDMVRYSVYAAIPPRAKRIFHHRIANELQAMGGEAARIAVHSARAGNRRAAFEAALRAAEQVQPLNWLGGADYFLRLAIENAPSDTDRFTASWKLAAYLMFAHRFAAAQEVWSECAKIAPAEELPLAKLGLRMAQLSRAVERADRPAAEILDDFASCLENTETWTRLAGSATVACSCIGNVALDQGRTDVLLKLVEVLQNLATIAASHAERSAAAGLVTTILCHVGRVDESIEWSDLAVQEAQLSGDNLTLVRALGARGACLMFNGMPRAAMTALEGCRERAKASGLAELYASTVLNYVVAVLDSGEFHRVEDVIDDVRNELIAEWGHRHIYVHMNLCFIRYEQGYYRDAERFADEVLLENQVLGSTCIHSNAWGVLGLCALYRNDRVAIQRAFDEISQSIDLVLSTADCTYPLLFLGRYWEARGNTSKAIAQLRSAVEFTRNRYRTCWALLSTELARLNLQKERARSIRTLGDLEDWAALNGCGLVLKHVHRARGNVLFPMRQ